MYVTIVYQRKKLYNEVWAEPVRTVAKRYGVSDVALAKTCRGHGVPLPPQGYWLRPESKRGKRPALPPRESGSAERWETSYHRQEERKVAPEVAARMAEERAPEAAITVSADLANPHRLVALSGKLLRKQTPYEGLVCCGSSPCLDIRVSPDALDRALRMMDALVRALETRGLKVELKDIDRPGYARASNVTAVVVDGELLAFALWERYSLETTDPGKPPKNLDTSAAEAWTRFRRRTDRVPNGRFALAIRDREFYGGKTFTDSPKTKIESSLNAFVAELYAAAADIKQRRVSAEVARVERAKEQERAYKAEERRQAEERRLKDFEELLERWHFSRDARELVREVRTLLTQRGLRVSRGGHIEEWLQWITMQAEKADPLADLRRDADKMATDFGTRRNEFKRFGSWLARPRRRGSR